MMGQLSDVGVVLRAAGALHARISVVPSSCTIVPCSAMTTVKFFLPFTSVSYAARRRRPALRTAKERQHAASIPKEALDDATHAPRRMCWLVLLLSCLYPESSSSSPDVAQDMAFILLSKHFECHNFQSTKATCWAPPNCTASQYHCLSILLAIFCRGVACTVRMHGAERPAVWSDREYSFPQMCFHPFLFPRAISARALHVQ